MPNRLPIYQVDAFTNGPFGGNPAAVCMLDGEYEDSLMASIAAEMNLSETAFLYPGDGPDPKSSSRFRLRWFTPKVEVPLCGHATLATAKVLLNEVGVNADRLAFDTLSGELTASGSNQGITLDFPAGAPEPCEPEQIVLDALGIFEYEAAALARDMKKMLVQVKDAEAVRAMTPDFDTLHGLELEGIIGVIVTARGETPYDFVSRFFAPWVGIDEDPVTGAAHTVLAPYWSGILGKEKMTAHQASERGGEMTVELKPGGRVWLTGEAVVVMKGELII